MNRHDQKFDFQLKQVKTTPQAAQVLYNSATLQLQLEHTIT